MFRFVMLFFLDAIDAWPWMEWGRYKALIMALYVKMWRAPNFGFMEGLQSPCYSIE